MKQIKIKELRAKTKFTQDDMAETLNISQNAYSLIENGITKLIDEERILIIAQKLNVNPIELGLFDGLGISQIFNDKVENGYINHIENLNADNKELVETLKEELKIKNIHIENILEQNKKLMEQMILLISKK